MSRPAPVAGMPRPPVPPPSNLEPLLPTVQLCRSSTIDLTALRLDTGNTDAAVFQWNVCFHPKLAKVAVATQGCITEYDVVSGSKLDSVELPGQTPVNLQYLGDGVTLAFVTKERHLMTFNWSSRRLRTLYVAGDTKGDTKAMTHMHLAVYPGARQFVFVSKHFSQAVRMVLATPRSKADKDLAVGVKLGSQYKKPIIGIAAHPYDGDVVLVAYQDGTLHGSQAVLKGSNLVSLWQVNIEADTHNLMRCAIKAEKHPFVVGSTLITVGTNTGTMSVWELPQRGDPRKLNHFSQEDGASLIGAGIINTSCLLACFFRNLRGQLISKVWRINATPTGNSLLVPLVSTPDDVWAAIDGIKPRVRPEDMPDAAFWRSVKLNGSASTGFGAFGDSARSGYDVSRIVVHPDGYLMAQMQPQPELLALRSRMDEKIEAGAMAAVQKVLHAPVLRLWDATHPPNGSLAPDVVPLQTDIDFWTPQGDDDTGATKLRLTFPKDFALLDAEGLRQYGLMSSSLSALANFPRASQLLAHRIVYSEKQKGWLIFFNAKTIKDVSKMQQHQGDSEYAIILQANIMQLSMGTMDTAPGLAGAFCGAQDELYAILANDMRCMELHRTVGDRSTIAIVQLPGSGAYSLFGCGQLVSALAELEGGAGNAAARPQSADSEKKKKKKKDKDGKDAGGPLADPKWVLWAQDGGLHMGDAAAASGKLDLPESIAGRYDKGVKRLGAIEASKSIILNSTEKVLQVCWQPLGVQHPGSLSSPTGTPSRSCLGAVVTTERLLVVDGDLRVLASNAPHDAHVQVLSALWAGPALFFSTSAEEVYQFNWAGRPLRCFALSNGCPCILAGALVDRLFVSTRVAGRTDVMARYFNIAPALLLGWAGLAGSGVLDGGLARARKAMVKVLRTYDTSSMEPAALAVLADSGFSDMALAVLKAHIAPKMDPDRHSGCVERCNTEAKALMAEYRASLYHPGPPPPSSVLYQRLVRCGRKAVMCAALSAARNCFEAAGQVTELIAVLVALQDKAALRGIAEQVEVQTTMMMDCEEMARLLYEVPEQVLMSSVRLQPDPISGSSYDGQYGQTWGVDVAQPGTQPAMLAAYSASDRGTIAPLDRTQLKHYVELEVVNVQPPPGGPSARGGVSAGGSAATSFTTGRTPPGSAPGTPPPEIEFEDDAQSGATPQGSFTPRDSSSDGEGPSNAQQQAAARAERVGSGATPIPDGFDSDSSDEEAASAPKFRITIKSKEESSRGPSSGADLARAVQSLKTIKWAGGGSGPSGSAGGLPSFLPPPNTGYGIAPQRAAPLAPGSRPGGGVGGPGQRPPPIVPPPGPGGGFAALSSMTSSAGSGGGGAAAGTRGGQGSSAAPTPTTDGNSVDALLDFLGGSGGSAAPSPARPGTPSGLDLFSDIAGPGPQSGGGGASQPAAAARAAAPRLPPGRAGQAYSQGFEAMARGDFGAASQQLQQAFDGTADAVSNGQVGVEQFQALVHSLAGSKLMAAAAKGPVPRAAKCARYAIMARIPDKQRIPLVQRAVEYNMKAGNYGFANELLMWLVTVCSGNAPPAVLDTIQRQMAACDGAGNRNTALLRGEDLGGFVSGLAACLQKGDLDKLLKPLLA